MSLPPCIEITPFGCYCTEHSGQLRRRDDAWQHIRSHHSEYRLCSKQQFRERIIHSSTIKRCKGTSDYLVFDGDREKSFQYRWFCDGCYATFLSKQSLQRHQKRQEKRDKGCSVSKYQGKLRCWKTVCGNWGPLLPGTTGRTLVVGPATQPCGLSQVDLKSIANTFAIPSMFKSPDSVIDCHFALVKREDEDWSPMKSFYLPFMVEGTFIPVLKRGIGSMGAPNGGESTLEALIEVGKIWLRSEASVDVSRISGDNRQRLATLASSDVGESVVNATFNIRRTFAALEKELVALLGYITREVDDPLLSDWKTFVSSSSISELRAGGAIGRLFFLLGLEESGPTTLPILCRFALVRCLKVCLKEK